MEIRVLDKFRGYAAYLDYNSTVYIRYSLVPPGIYAIWHYEEHGHSRGITDARFINDAGYTITFVRRKINNEFKYTTYVVEDLQSKMKHSIRVPYRMGEIINFVKGFQLKWEVQHRHAK